MHGTENMAAMPYVEGLSPSLKHELPCPRPLPENAYTYIPNNKVFTTIAHTIANDDDFSDHDSHYSEDLIEDFSDEKTIPEKTPDITQQLLNFAEMVNSDIQKFFGRKKGDEDSCDIYEDKWTCRKSGREQYYADLLKLAQGDSFDNKNATLSKPDIDNRNQFSGKLDKHFGLGPLNELFDYGLSHFLVDTKLKSKKLKRLKQELKKYSNVLPMHQRKLPQSFWMEPGSKDSSITRMNSSNIVLLNNANPPDFSDLLQSWTGEIIEFNGELSSSDVSMASPESDSENS